MIEYFPAYVLKKAIAYTVLKSPFEACGFFIKPFHPGYKKYKFIPCENIAEDKEFNFRISGKDFIEASLQGEIKCILHSHNNCPWVSEADQISQQKHRIPFGVIFLSNGGYSNHVFFGDELPTQDLISRPFIHGIFDCYGTVRDHYRKELNITLTNYTREDDWWKTDNNLLEGHMIEENFYKVDLKDIQKNDVILFKIRGKNPNHSAIYLGQDLILHHLYGQLSCREPIGRYRRFISGVWRHK